MGSEILHDSNVQGNVLVSQGGKGEAKLKHWLLCKTREIKGCKHHAANSNIASRHAFLKIKR